jgi:hypothetical protein
VTSPWTDADSTDYSDKSYCYSVSAISTAGLESHIANPVCFWGTAFERVTKIEANGFDQTPNASDHGRSHFADWGIPAAVLSVSSFTPPSTGTYLFKSNTEAEDQSTQESHRVLKTLNSLTNLTHQLFFRVLSQCLT